MGSTIGLLFNVLYMLSFRFSWSEFFSKLLFFIWVALWCVPSILVGGKKLLLIISFWTHMVYFEIGMDKTPLTYLLIISFIIVNRVLENFRSFTSFLNCILLYSLHSWDQEWPMWKWQKRLYLTLPVVK